MGFFFSGRCLMPRYGSPEYSRRYRSPPRDRYRSPPRRRPRGGSSADRESGCLFVGNLPYDYTEHDIKSLFKKMGEIETVTIGMNHKTGQPKGHAFVQFRHPRDAQDTYRQFQDHVIAGRPLRIDWDAGKDKKMTSYRSRRPYDRPRYSRRDSYSPRRRYSPSPRRRRRDSRSPRRDSRSPPRRRDSPPRSYGHSPSKGSRSPGRSPARSMSPKGTPDNSWSTTSPPNAVGSPARRSPAPIQSEGSPPPHQD